MSFFAILLALLIEQARPLLGGNWIHASQRAWMRWVLRHADAGQLSHGWLVWSLVVALPTALACLMYVLAEAYLGWLPAMCVNVFFLYATLGFRQFSHHFTAVRDALEAGDEALARTHLAQWQHAAQPDLAKGEIIRSVLETSVVAAHRHVFGVLCWFSCLAALGLGPAGAVLYRLSEFTPRYWAYLSARQHWASQACTDVAALAWRWIDALPARVTALCFAVVGSFEESIDSWRQYSAGPLGNSDGIVIAAAAGAVNVRLDAAPGSLKLAPAHMAHLRSVVGLVWRTVVLWMVLLALLTLARLLG